MCYTFCVANVCFLSRTRVAHRGKSQFPLEATPMTPIPATAREIGQKVRACRLARNMTQQELAGGVFSKSYVSQVERGAVEPSLRALKFLAARLGVSCS